MHVQLECAVDLKAYYVSISNTDLVLPFNLEEILANLRGPVNFLQPPHWSALALCQLPKLLPV